MNSEHTLLSIIAQDPEWTRKHASQLSPVLFSNEANRHIFEAVTECGSEWDMTSITNALRRRGKLDDVGGAAGVSELFNDFPVMSMAQHHLTTVRDATTLRRALQCHQAASERLNLALTVGTNDAAALLAEIREELDSAGKLPGKRLERLSSAQAMEMALDTIEARAARPGEIPGLTTGFALLDSFTYGLQPGHLWVIAGGPSDGKSTVMQNILEGAVGTGAKCAVYQLEMPIEEQAIRFLSSDSGVNSGSLLTGTMTHEEQQALAASFRRLQKMGMDYVNVDGANADDILSDIEQGDYEVVMVDYLQLLDVTTAKGESREQAVSNVARKLKNLAKRKAVTILTGSQLNDDGQLRESRAIGQHADKVLYVSKVETNGEADETRRSLDIKKNRGGPRGKRIQLRFAGASFRFREMGEDDAEPDWIGTMQDKPKTRRARR
jgi:replicative DNA helicase